MRRPKLGASLADVNQLIRQGVGLPIESGLLVRGVLPGSAAQRAGLRGLQQDNTGEIILGDIITSVDGTAMNSIDDLYKFLDKKQINDTVQIEIFRDGKRLTVPMKLINLPQSPQGAAPRRY